MIKNFLYLDVDKLNSLSSQMFEGSTQYILNETISQSEDATEQKGEFGSGRVIQDILKNSDKTSEKKFLYDYSYLLLEKELTDSGKVVSIDKDFNNEKLVPSSFVKVKGKVIFNDVNSIQNTMENYEELHKAISHFQASNIRKKEVLELEQQIKKSEKIAEKERIQKEVNKLKNSKLKSTPLGSMLPRETIKSVSFLINYGFQDQFEVCLEKENLIFLANLKREYLREKEDLIIRKYARNTQVDFVLFGFITQSNNDDLTNLNSTDKTEATNMKASIMKLVNSLSRVEETFTGRQKNEIIIDPIALYTQL